MLRNGRYVQQLSNLCVRNRVRIRTRRSGQAKCNDDGTLLASYIGLSREPRTSAELGESFFVPPRDSNTADYGSLELGQSGVLYLGLNVEQLTLNSAEYIQRPEVWDSNYFEGDEQGIYELYWGKIHRAAEVMNESSRPESSSTAADRLRAICLWVLCADASKAGSWSDFRGEVRNLSGFLCWPEDLKQKIARKLYDKQRTTLYSD